MVVHGAGSDPDIIAVAAFMQRTVPAERLLSVAAGVASLAPLVWTKVDGVQSSFRLVDPQSS